MVNVECGEELWIEVVKHPVAPLLLSLLTDLCHPVALLPVHPVCPAQIPECGSFGHQCDGDPAHRYHPSTPKTPA